MLTTLIVIGCTTVYSFIGLTAGIIARRATKYSKFWDDDLAAFLMILLWPIAIPTVYFFRIANKAAHKTVNMFDAYTEQKSLPKATVKKT